MILVMLLGAGLLFGSFVNALVWRLHAKRNWLTERSECSHCHHVLGPLDLVPLFSWIYLRGKCRYCGKRIEDSPWVEATTALFFALSYLAWPVELQGVGLYQFSFWLLFIVLFMALAVYDLRWFLLPNNLVFPLAAAVLLYILGLPLFFHYEWRVVIDALLGAGLLSGLFYLLFQMSKGQWIGGGDVKLAIALGLLAGDPLRSLLLLFVASFLGTLTALPQLATKKRQALKLKLPFGPFLLAATVVVVFFGAPIIAWYVTTLTS